MNNVLAFGLGVLCGFVGTIILLFIYCSFRIKDIEKK